MDLREEALILNSFSMFKRHFYPSMKNSKNIEDVDPNLKAKIMSIFPNMMYEAGEFKSAEDVESKTDWKNFGDVSLITDFDKILQR